MSDLDNSGVFEDDNKDDYEDDYEENLGEDNFSQSQDAEDSQLSDKSSDQ